MRKSFSKFISGTAFHCYAGDYKSPYQLAQEFPSKAIFFTECSGYGPDDQVLIRLF